MCIRDRGNEVVLQLIARNKHGESGNLTLADITFQATNYACLLYTSDAADERSSVDLGGRRIIKKQKPHPIIALYFTHRHKLNIYPLPQIHRKQQIQKK